MKPRKRFFISNICKKIKNDLLVVQQELDDIPTIAIGDLELLPSPENLLHKNTAKQYLPAIFIIPDDLYNTTVSGNKSISNGEYLFLLKFVNYYDVDNTLNIVEESIEKAELIAEYLMDDSLIDNTPNFTQTGSAPSYVELFDSDNNPVGQILATEVQRIRYNTLETEVFNTLKLPIVVVDIYYSVLFRSYYIKK